MVTMKPWAGGECAPEDWDGTVAVDRRGVIGTYTHLADAWKRREIDLPDDIVAYSSKDEQDCDRMGFAALHQLQHSDQTLSSPVAGASIVAWAALEISCLRAIIAKATLP